VGPRVGLDGRKVKVERDITKVSGEKHFFGDSCVITVLSTGTNVTLQRV